MKQRVFSGFIGGFIFLSVLIIGGIWFGILIICLALLAYIELMRLSRLPVFSLPSLLGLFFLCALLLQALSKADSVRWLNVSLDMERMMMGFIVLFLFLTLIGKQRISVEHIGTLFIGVFYLGFGFAALMDIRFTEGLYLLFFILLITWTSDTAAYFTGKKFGKRKLWPMISPNKTLEGHLGAIFFSIVFALVFQWVTQYYPTYVESVGLAMLISVAGQIGDLIESALKRHFTVKDSGRLLPGHGGVLDRFDSLLFVLVTLDFLYML